jgi:lipopolysaccharide biosynthesis glycosyltransferase
MINIVPTPCNVFIGYDYGEPVAYHILSESIRSHASGPVSITPLSLNNLREFKRAKESNQSTDFAFSRFLVPYLSKYKGWSIYMDCDMMFRSDIYDLYGYATYKYSVMCCKHDYIPKQDVKFRGAKNEAFPKKNWSSVMLFHNSQCTALTPEYVNKASGLELHQFKWLEREHMIGDIPLEWNWLVNEYNYNPDAKNVHWTLGGPWYKDYENQDYADEWFHLYDITTKVRL